METKLKPIIAHHKVKAAYQCQPNPKIESKSMIANQKAKNGDKVAGPTQLFILCLTYHVRLNISQKKIPNVHLKNIFPDPKNEEITRFLRFQKKICHHFVVFDY